MPAVRDQDATRKLCLILRVAGAAILLLGFLAASSNTNEPARCLEKCDWLSDSPHKRAPALSR